MRYLLEIGVEELPARYVKMALSQLKEKAEKLLKENLIGFSSTEVYASPRRLTLFINDIDNNQEDIEEWVKGPSKKICFDEENKPSKPLEGFMKSQGLSLDDIEFRDLKGTEYAYGFIHKKGLLTKDLFKTEIANLIKSINFPKNMRWGGKNIRFARPIRWIVSMADSEVWGFDFEGIKVSNVTRGHRFLGSDNILIDHVNNYEKLLKENYVILNQEERKEIIKYGSKKKAKSLGGEIYEDEDLLEELTFINEYPTPIVGNVKEEYLSLPKAVITTPMRDHLRFIPIYAEDGELLPYFITIRNGTSDHEEIVARGNEKVLGARLEDAKFFYKEDISKPLEDYVDALHGLIFQDKLGTMYEKSQRIKKLSGQIGEYLKVADETIDALDRASILAKADLTTHMVTEFTELQGLMGSIYAELSGEEKIVSKAIYEHYLPRFAGDELPKSTTGSILAIADKIDTIVGLFAIGLVPTGSQDPFALRRLAIGVINIILEKNWDVNLEEITDYALYNYVQENNLTFDYEKVKEQIIEFFKGRLKNILEERNIRYDIIDAVIDDSKSIVDVSIKADKLQEYFKEDKGELVDAIKRIHNLAKKYTEGTFDVALLKEEQEKEFFSAYESIKESFNDSIATKKYTEALDIFKTIVKEVNNYFDNIMVLTEDEELKNNRLAMLKEIDNSLKEVLNIEKITE